MGTVEIIQKIRKNDKVDKVVLKDANGLFIMPYDEICKEVYEGSMSVIGYTVVSVGDELMLKEARCKSESDDSDKYIVIDRDMLELVEQNTRLGFKTVSNLSDEVLKFDGEVYRVSQNCFIESVNDSVTVVSNKIFKIMDGYELFQDKQFKSVDLSNVDMTDIETTERMFEGCSIQNVELACGGTNKLRTMKAMFMNSTIRTLNIKSLQTKNVDDMSYMFCNSNIGKLRTSRRAFNTHNVVDMTKMFFRCTNDTIKNAKVEDFNVNSLLSADFMFSKCEADVIDLNNWAISDVISMKGCFSGSRIGTLIINKENLPDSEEMFINATINNI